MSKEELIEATKEAMTTLGVTKVIDLLLDWSGRAVFMEIYKDLADLVAEEM